MQIDHVGWRDPNHSGYILIDGSLSLKPWINIEETILILRFLLRHYCYRETDRNREVDSALMYVCCLPYSFFTYA